VHGTGGILLIPPHPWPLFSARAGQPDTGQPSKTAGVHFKRTRVDVFGRLDRARIGRRRYRGSARANAGGRVRHMGIRDAKPIGTQCIRCVGQVNVLMEGWTPDGQTAEKPWICPRCQAANAITVSGHIVGVRSQRGMSSPARQTEPSCISDANELDRASAYARAPAESGSYSANLEACELRWWNWRFVC
jgi:hypothetical protein